MGLCIDEMKGSVLMCEMELGVIYGSRESSLFYDLKLFMGVVDVCVRV